MGPRMSRRPMRESRAGHSRPGCGGRSMSQAVWTGTITFGLVNIPVKLYPATEPKDVRFHLYDRRTGKRVRYERVTRAEDVPAFEPESSSSVLSGERVESRPGVRTDSAPFGE